MLVLVLPISGASTCCIGWIGCSYNRSLTSPVEQLLRAHQVSLRLRLQAFHSILEGSRFEWPRIPSGQPRVQFRNWVPSSKKYKLKKKVSTAGNRVSIVALTKKNPRLRVASFVQRVAGLSWGCSPVHRPHGTHRIRGSSGITPGCFFFGGLWWTRKKTGHTSTLSYGYKMLQG